MKFYKSILMTAVAAFALASCSDEADFKDYNGSAEGKTEQFSFAQAAQDFSYTPADSIAETVNFSFVRNTTKGEKAVLLAVTQADDDVLVFADEELAGKDTIEVVFPDGQNKIDLPVTVNSENATMGVEYTLGLQVVNDSVTAQATAPAGNSTAAITFFLDYTWISAGSCQMYSQWVGNDDPIRIPIQQAKESEMPLYRLVSPYYIMEPNYCDADNPETRHIQFYLDNDGNALAVSPALQYIGKMDEDGEWYIYCNPKAYPQYCYFENDGNEFWMGVLFGYGGALNYIIEEYFLWDDGYPGAE